MTNSAKAANLYMAKVIGKDMAIRQSDPDIRQTSAELQGWLVALASVYPDTTSDEYKQFFAYMDQALWSAVPKDEPVWEIRKLLIKLAMRFGPSSFPPAVSS